VGSSSSSSSSTTITSITTSTTTTTTSTTTATRVNPDAPRRFRFFVLGFVVTHPGEDDV